MKAHRRLFAVLAALVAITGACGSDTKTAPSTAAPTTEAPVADAPDTTVVATTDSVATAPYETKTLLQTFVDTSRPTPATASSAELPSRTIETMIVYPDAPGPFPLIVLSHGLTGTPAKLSRLSTEWAVAGYVVAMPAFPLTNGFVTGADANINDVVSQPGDVSFVIDRVLALSGDDSAPLFGRVDAEHIGVAGHSLGSATTYGVAFNSCCIDKRIDAVVIMAGLVIITPAENDFSRALPVMILHGDADPVLNISLDQAVYDQLGGPKWFVTLKGGGHSTGIEDGDSPLNGVVAGATTGFWNTYLSAHPTPASVLHSDLEAGDLSTLQTSE